ncbi:MAG: hypothetical protein A2Y97_08820 [Nitrospirae bacterium RBG_13_39_12]|nr:MAG: hypothetical protein A2Y97_08820 [Nitrospirae bacterium RBG_13_39_12]
MRILDPRFSVIPACPESFCKKDSRCVSLAGIISFIAFVVLGSTQIDTSGRGWKALYHQGVIDEREYYPPWRIPASGGSPRRR